MNTSTIFQLGLLLCIFHLTHCAPTAAGKQKVYHALIIDAGSTGTRTHYFTFLVDKKASFGLKMNGSQSSKVNPGLSAFVGNDKGAKESILGLIDKVSPVDEGSDLELQATAGMRLVQMKNKEAAQHMMVVLKKMLIDKFGTSLHICDDCVKISSGEEEGLYSYVAANYLLGNFDKDKKNPKMAGVIEIGGASMQIVLPDVSNDNSKCNANVAKGLQTLLKNQCTFSKTFFPYGMEMARHAFLQVPRQCVFKVCPDKQGVHQSPCFQSNFTKSVSLGETKVTIAGEAGVSPKDRYKKCYKSIDSHLDKHIHNEGPPKKVLNGNIGQPIFLLGGSVTHTLRSLGYEYNTPIYLKDIEKYAKTACHQVVATGAFAPFKCINLVYLSRVLNEGFRFTDNQVFIVAPTINGVNVEWSLGAALESILHHMNR